MTQIPKTGCIHFIGVAGSAIAPIAVMMKKKGWKVSGSDENVFEPALSMLEGNDIEWANGYDAQRIETADLVVVGGGPLLKNINNVEFVRATQLGKPLISFAVLIGQYAAKKENIVVSGSYGKTTTTAMIAKILETAKVNPSYMMGGKPVDFSSGVKSAEGEYSVLEGDEFPASFGFDMEPKFIYYKPKYAILSATKWDHLDVYTTQESYVEAYYKLTKLVEKNEGQLILCSSGENNEKVAKQFKGDLITYMVEGKKNLLKGKPQYVAKDVKFGEEFTSFTIEHNGESLGAFKTPLIGVHNVENCLAAMVASYEASISLKDIKKGLKDFGGVKRRQEVIGKTKGGAVIMDDFAHSPMKAQATVEALRTRYKKEKIIVIYKPRMSERADNTVLQWYPDAFTDVDHVIIPKMTVKKSMDKDKRVTGKDLVGAIKKGNKNAYYMPKEDAIVEFIEENADKDTLVVFMSAGGWGELIERVAA